MPARTAAPAAPPAPVGPPPPKPDIPVVAAAKARKKIPFWAFATLSTLPLWAFMYVRALTPTTEKIAGPLGEGATVYSGCSGCHGPAGEGGVGYQFSQGEVLKTFPHIEDQLRWVDNGSDAYAAAGVADYGDPNRPGGAHITKARGAMPAQAGQLTEAQILAVVCHERFTLGGADPAAPTRRSTPTGALPMRRLGWRSKTARPPSTTSTRRSPGRSRSARTRRPAHPPAAE